MTAATGALAFQPLQPVPIHDVVIEDEFWALRRETWRSVTIPYLTLPAGRSLAAEHCAGFLGGVTVIRGQAQRGLAAAWPDRLYLSGEDAPRPRDTPLTAVPYYANGNRQAGHTAVWVRETMPPPSGL